MKRGLMYTVGGLTIGGFLLAKSIFGGLEARVAEAASQHDDSVAVEKSYDTEAPSFYDIHKKHLGARSTIERKAVIGLWEDYVKKAPSEEFKVNALYNLGVQCTALSPDVHKKEFQDGIEALKYVAIQNIKPSLKDDAYLLIGDAYAQLGKYKDAKLMYQIGVQVEGDMKGVLEKRLEGIEYNIQRTQR